MSLKKRKVPIYRIERDYINAKILTYEGFEIFFNETFYYFYSINVPPRHETLV